MRPPPGRTRTIAKLLAALLLGAAAAFAAFQMVGHGASGHRGEAADNADPGLIP